MNCSRTVPTLVVSNFNAENLVGYLCNDTLTPRIEASTTRFGQVAQTLTDLALHCGEKPVDLLIVWTQPHRVMASFNAFLDNSRLPIGDLIEEVDAYSRLIKRVAERIPCVLVPTWVVTPYNRGLGMIDLKSEYGVASLLMRANIRLADNLRVPPNIYVLNAQRWMELAGARNSHNPKLWYMGKIGFGNEVFREAARDVKAALRGIAGLARKLIILDLDDTLWGGVVGDVGWEGIRLGGHDPVGEAFGDFQAQLKALRNRGVLLGIVSKNEESAAVEAITRNPEMRLRLDDFAGWRINWSDKVSNIRALALELNLGLQSVVFIDDNPVERSRVREALPELLVPEWPDDKLLYGKALLDLDCFDVPTISEEDLQRTQLYAAERKRQAIREEVKSFDEWLPTLGMKVIVERLSPSNLPRTAQLLNKTNQMNLSTRRMTEGELATWADQDNHWVWTFRVADRFGDSGLTGIVSIVREGSSATIADFVLSCRVMGRRVEETMLHFVAGATRQLGMKQLKATYAPTARNKVCLTFWKECSGFEVGADGESFTLRLETSYPLPKGVELIAEDAS